MRKAIEACRAFGGIDHVVEFAKRTGGAWSLRALYDGIAAGHYVQSDAKGAVAEIAAASCGLGAVKYADLLRRRFGLSEIPDPPRILTDLPYLFDISKLRTPPTISSPHYWFEALADFVEVGRQDLWTAVEAAVDTPIRRNLSLGEFEQSLKDVWSNFHEALLPGGSHNGARVLFDEDSRVVWRTWHLSDLGVPTIRLHASDLETLTARLYVWRLIHDATHLWHISASNRAPHFTDPIDMASYEAVAMYAEHEFLQRILCDEAPALPWLASPQIKKCVATGLLLGMFERALRSDFDFRVHYKGQDPASWVESSIREFGCPRQLLSFAEEFHGMPGFPASYMLGLANVLALRKDEQQDLLRAGVPDLEAWWSPDPKSTAAETNIPDRGSPYAVNLEAAGVVGSAATLRLLQSDSDTVSVPVDISVAVDLPPERRGVHMSRFQEIAAALGDLKFDSPGKACDWVAREAQRRLGSATAIATMNLREQHFTISEMSRIGAAMHLETTYKVELLQCESRRTLQVSFPIMTACPCTLAYSMGKARDRGTRHRHLADPRAVPTFTHSQPGKAKITVTRSIGDGSWPIAAHLREATERVCTLRHPVLKRPDEHRLVERAHRRPQFGEDVVRIVMASVSAGLVCGDLVMVETLLDESIHGHQVYAKGSALVGQEAAS